MVRVRNLETNKILSFRFFLNTGAARAHVTKRPALQLEFFLSIRTILRNLHLNTKINFDEYSAKFEILTLSGQSHIIHALTAQYIVDDVFVYDHYLFQENITMLPSLIKEAPSQLIFY